MAKEKPTELESLETDVTYYIEQCKEYPYSNQWVIYTDTKYGKKMFMNYLTQEDAISASICHKLNMK